jgi:hypothetical protein
LNVFKKRGFFTFEVVADELKNPGHHKNCYACRYQNTALVEGVHNAQKHGGAQQHADRERPRQAGVVHQAGSKKYQNNGRVNRKHQTRQAQHDGGNGDVMNQLIDRVGVAQAVMRKQGIDFAFWGVQSSVFYGLGHRILLA